MHLKDALNRVEVYLENETRVTATRHDAMHVMPCHTWDFNACPLTSRRASLMQVWHRTKSLAAILGGKLFGGSVLLAQYCPCGQTFTEFTRICNDSHKWRHTRRGEGAGVTMRDIEESGLSVVTSRKVHSGNCCICAMSGSPDDLRTMRTIDETIQA